MNGETLPRLVETSIIKVALTKKLSSYVVWCTVGNTTVFHGRYSLFHTVGLIRWHSSHFFSSCVTRMWQMITSSWSPVPTYPM